MTGGARRQFHEQGMGKIYWNIAASAALIAFSLTAAAAPDRRDAGSAAVVAQASQPAAPATTPSPD
jgi:hypothetical protein